MNTVQTNKEKILIAGIGSGSLGLELLKCLSIDDTYLIYGADIDRHAYGHSDSRFTRTYVVEQSDSQLYCNELISICEQEHIQYIAPGAEATNRILCLMQDTFRSQGLFPLVNSKEVFNICSDKVSCNNFLKRHGFPSLETRLVPIGSSLHSFSKFPCVVKPAKDSGGSNLVFLAENLDEAKFFVGYLADRGGSACVQEYIDSPDEFTVGVLSSPKGEVLSSIALQRNLTSKLSRSLAYGSRVISSGWSQGRIEEFPMVCKQAELIAMKLQSTWAINIQGRLRDGVFIPFEINPRHSGTSFFRALSGVNEIVIGLDYLKNRRLSSEKKPIKSAIYSRILTERVKYDTGETI